MKKSSRMVSRDTKSGEFVIKGTRKGGTESIQVARRDEKTGRWVTETFKLPKGKAVLIQAKSGKKVRFGIALETIGRDGNTGKFVSAGKTKDGIQISRPRGNPDNFTKKEVRHAVTTVRSLRPK